MTNKPKAFFLWAMLALAFASARVGQGALQFDAFIGFDGKVHEAGWFPVAFEIFNDGPGFNAVIEISSGHFGQDQRRQIPIELPTNTRKRLVVPMFASGGRFTTQWEARLLTPNGKVIEERLNLQTQIVPWESTMMGAVPGSFSGSPTYPDGPRNRNQMASQPEVARMLVEQFPDNPIALEGLDVLYLNSEKAIDLKLDQITALLGWVRGGGHLIVAVENPGDVNGTPWLRQFLPAEFTATANTVVDRAVMQWLRSRPDASEDPLAVLQQSRRLQNQSSGASYSAISIEELGPAEMPVSTGELKDGRVLVSSGPTPLMINAPRGRGSVTVLTFNPELEPFRSWKGRGYFWARVSGIPADVFTSAGNQGYGGWSVDGVFGALIDSRQIKKLPVTWLLLLLVVYLVVIGPFDQWWLKKINRQMLTWITFPAYVVLFSLLIYFIGYKLRAGETEWNEFHIVDILPRGEKVDLRGRTYISIYSSSNARYPLDGEEGFATLRGELMDLYSGGREGSKATVVQDGNSFKAEVSVPVWTSLLYANDWFQTNDTPLLASVSYNGAEYVVDLENLMSEPLTDIRVALKEIIFEIGSLQPNESKTVTLAPEKSTGLKTFVQQHGSHFQRAVELRRNPMGTTAGGQLENPALTATVVSFLSYLDQYGQGNRQFVSPGGLDMTASVERGDAVILGYAPNFSFTDKINAFTPPRFKRDTFVRLTVPVRRPNT